MSRVWPAIGREGRSRWHGRRSQDASARRHGGMMGIRYIFESCGVCRRAGSGKHPQICDRCFERIPAGSVLLLPTNHQHRFTFEDDERTDRMIREAELRASGQTLSVRLIRRAVALLNNLSAKLKGQTMSWHFKKTGTREQVLKFLLDLKIHRYPDASGKDANADQMDAVRDSLVECTKTLPPKFTCAALEASGHVDQTGSAQCKMRFEGLDIELPLPTRENPAPVECLNEPPTHPAAATEKEAGTNTTAPAPVVAGTAAP